MSRRSRAFLILLQVPVFASAQSVDEVFEGIIDQEMASYGAVEDYLLETETMGMTTMEYYEKTSSFEHEVNGETKTFYIMRNVPVDEIQERQTESPFADASPADLRFAATQIESAMAQIEAGMMQEMAESGFGAGPGGIGAMMMQGPPPRPDGTREIWLSANPRDMGTMYSTMLNAAAEAKERRAAEDPEGDARQRVADLSNVRELTRIVPCEESAAADVICLAADDLGFTQTEDGVQFTMNRMRMRVNRNRYVPMLLTIDGTMVRDGETRDVRIEREDSDYRDVPGCGDMYEPYRSVMRMSGVLSAEEQAQLQEAQVQLAEFEQQMASMPPGQREMVMRQVGPQMEMLKSMASSGGMEIESKIRNITCNAGLPDPAMMAQTMMTGGALGAAMPGHDLRPYYVDEKGVGVIRYSGAVGEYFLNVKNTGGKVLAGPMGPYSGPNVGVFIGSLAVMGVPLEQLELELFQKNPQRTAARYQPTVDPARAEGEEDCGAVSSIGECSN